MRFGHRSRRRSAAFLPRWLLPLSTTQKTRRARRVRLGAHHLVDEPGERLDPRLGFTAPEDLGPVHIPGGQVLKRPAPVVLELDRAFAPRCSTKALMAADAGLDGGLLVGGDHVVRFAEGPSLPLSGVQVEHPGRLWLEGTGRGERSTTGCAMV